VDSTNTRSPFRLGKLVWLGLGVLLCGFPCRSQQTSVAFTAKSAVFDLRVFDLSTTDASILGQQTDPQRSGRISGRVVDQTGAFITGASVKMLQEGHPSSAEVLSDEDGQFLLLNVAPGPFHLTITAPGLASQEFSGVLNPGEAYVTPIIMMAIATQVTEVHVGLTPDQIADAQIKQQEKQRVLGIIPNFYVSYIPNAAPLRPKRKFELAWKSARDPFTFVAVGFIAGLNQAGDRWGGYGQGVEGYAKRYGATYADVFVGTFIGGAILPTLLKQDPRYFYKGTGTKRSRILYALANSVICKGDNGHWQPNYSNIGGNLAAGGISNLYYPASDRNGVGLVFSTAMIRLGETAVANIFQEFIAPKLTPNVPRRASGQP
jgi:hypothetical protein